MIDQVFVAVIAFLLFVYLLNTNKRLPPGPLRWPVLGSSIQVHLAHSTLPHLALAKLADKYGDIYSFGFGSQLAVVVSSYEGMHEIFKLNETNASRYTFPFIEDRNYGKNMGIIFSGGRKWIETRTFTKKIMREFGYGKLKIMDKSLVESAEQLVDTIKTSILDSHDGTFSVKNSIFSVHVLNILWEIVGGYKFDPNDELLKRNMKCVDKAVYIYGNRNPYNVFPLIRTWFPSLVNYPEHLKVHEEIHGFSKVKSSCRSGWLNSEFIFPYLITYFWPRTHWSAVYNLISPYLQFLINHAMEKRGERMDADPTSVIEVFIDKIEEEHENPDSIFTQEQLEIIVEDLMLGSLETTGTIISWAIIFMVLHPDKQNKVRQVILDKRAEQGFLPAIELKRIPYVKATILEIFRLGNVAPIPSPRLATADIKLRDYVIPKGTMLFYNLYPIYKDKNFWKDPETFRPERFLTENGVIDKLTSERILNTVFGLGARVCFGENIGLDSFYTYFAALITNFKFETIPGQEPSTENVHFAITVCPDEYNVKVTKLST